MAAEKVRAIPITPIIIIEKLGSWPPFFLLLATTTWSTKRVETPTRRKRKGRVFRDSFSCRAFNVVRKESKAGGPEKAAAAAAAGKRPN